MKGEVLKGHLDSLLLAALEAGPSHGYAIIERLRQRSDKAFVLPEGTVYPALHRIEQEGLIVAQWERYAGRGRRVYRLSPHGRRRLARQRQEWRQFSRAVTLALESR